MGSVLDGLGPHHLGFYEDKDSMAHEDYNFGDTSVDLKRVFLGSWLDAPEFIRAAVFLEIDGDPNTGTQTITSPARYPRFPAARAFRASCDALLKASGKDDDNNIVHRIAKVTVYYRLENFGGGEGEDDPNENDPDFLYIEESVVSHTEIIPIHGVQTRVASHADEPSSNPDGSPYKTSGTYLFEEIKTRNYINTIYDYKLKVPYIIYPRWLHMANATGKVNNSTFITPSGNVCLAGTLRFDGIAAITKRELSQGALVWEIEFAFAYRREGWNTVPVISEDGVDICHQFVEPVLFTGYELRLIFIPYSTSNSNELRRIGTNWGNVGTPTRYIKARYGILTEDDAATLWNALPNHAFLNARPIILPDNN